MNFLLPLLSFFIGNAKSLFKEPGVAITQQLALHLRALTMVLVSTLGSLALTCVGLSLFIASLAGQLDKDEAFSFSASMLVYLGMTVVSSGILIYSLNRKTWMKALGFAEKPAAPKQSGALENAVALLVMDYVEERQSKRSEKQTHAS